MRRWLALLMLLLAALPALAIGVDSDTLADPAQESRARALMSELRCLVCQNQSISDSDAPLATDLRHLVRERIAAGDSDTEVKAYLVARYGDWILLQPPLRAGTLLLWIGPLLVVIVGLVLLRQRFRTRALDTPPPLSEAERAALHGLDAP